MVQLVLVLDAAQDRDRVLDRRLLDIDRLEAPLERGVLLDIFLVFIERGRADAVELAAAERGLQKVRGIHRAFGRARADQGVHLVDEQDDLAVGVLHLVEHRLQPLLEFAAIFRARDQRAHVEAHQRAALEAVGHVAIGDAQRQAFGNRGLAGAGLADQRGVVLGAPGEDLDRAADFLVAADYRIKLAIARGLGEVAGEFRHRVIGVLGAGAVGALAAAESFDRGVERLGRNPGGLQGLARRALRQRERDQQAFDSDVAVACLVGDLLGLIEHPDRVIIETRGRLRTAPGDSRNLGEARIDSSHRQRSLAARALDESGGHALAILEQRLQQVQRGNALVVYPDRDGLGALQEALGPVGELLEIHNA